MANYIQPIRKFLEEQKTENQTKDYPPEEDLDIDIRDLLSYTEHIAINLDRSMKYSEYLAESMDEHFTTIESISNYVAFLQDLYGTGISLNKFIDMSQEESDAYVKKYARQLKIKNILEDND